MTAYRKNIMVGVIMIGALVILGWMIIQFGGASISMFVEKQIPVHLLADRAEGVSDGSAITFRGVVVGRVTLARLSDDQKQVVIDALINSHPVLPQNVVGVIRFVGLVGGVASITLETSGPSTGKPLQVDQNIPTRYVGSDFIPPEFAQLAKDLSRATT